MPPPHIICQWQSSSIRVSFVSAVCWSQPGPMTKTFVSARWTAALSCGMLLNCKQQGRKSRFWTQSRGGGWFRWFSERIILCDLFRFKMLLFRGGVCFMILKVFGICRAVPPSHYIYSNSDPQDDQLHLYCVGFQPKPSRKKNMTGIQPFRNFFGKFYDLFMGW